MSMSLAIQATMVGRIDRCLLLSYRVPALFAQPLLPPGLELVTLDARAERWAFFNIVVCHVEAMRPKGFMPSLGISYNHVAYRLNVRAQTRRDVLTGLYFLRSDVDDGMVALAGQPVSDFKFHKAAIRTQADPSRFSAAVTANDPEAAASVDADLTVPARLADDSVFSSLENARAFLKYQPLGIAPSANTGKLRLAEVFREERDWRERPVAITSAQFAFLRAKVPSATLELATWVDPIDYVWRLGRTVRC